jgi:hypothetical protein
MLAALAGSLVLALTAQLGPPPQLPRDSVEKLRREARRAEAEFERLSRSLVPVRWSGGGTDCDEIVGRFCLTYDSGRPPEPDAEHGRVVDARRTAIEALRAAFSWMPADFATAAPLVRYLVEDRRPAEALSAARLYAIESGDSIWSPQLLAFAAHAAGDDTTAERLFDEVLPRLSQRDQERVQDIAWLLEASDRGLYGKLEAAQRRSFERRFWKLADPLYLTPGNESRSEHFARHVWSRVLERAPVVAGMLSWGPDMEQLTVRYGVPVGRTRSPATITHEGSLMEHFDPDQLAYTPIELLRRGPPPVPLPGRPWELDRKRSRFGYAPETLRRVVALAHQATVLPDGQGVVLRVDGRMVMDSAARGAAEVETALFVLDSELRPVRAERGHASVVSDTARFWFETRLPRGSWLYSLEALEAHSRLGGRARYFLDDETLPGPLRVSDPLISQPWSPGQLPPDRGHPSLRPRADLVISPADTLGFYAEAQGLTAAGSFVVRLALEPASRASLPGRLVRWLGGRIGLGRTDRATRLQWTSQADPDGRAVLALEVRPAGRPDGDYVLILDITDAATGATAGSRRVIRFGQPVRE